MTYNGNKDEDLRRLGLTPAPASNHSHEHCWDQKQPPACGFKWVHKVCCLCGETPKDFNLDQPFHSNIAEAMKTPIWPSGGCCANHYTLEEYGFCCEYCPNRHASTAECKHGTTGVCWQCAEGVTLYSGASTTDWRGKLELGGDFIDFEGDLRVGAREELVAFIEKQREIAYNEGYEKGKQDRQ